jgi:hypothetical protein
LCVWRIGQGSCVLLGIRACGQRNAQDKLGVAEQSLGVLPCETKFKRL